MRFLGSSSSCGIFVIFPFLVLNAILFCYSLLKDDPDFKFEFRGAIEFKNVPAPVKCYYLVENINKDDYAPIVVTDEQEMFQFMMTATPTSPPVTPMTSTNHTLASSPGDSMAEVLSQTSDDYQLSVPFPQDNCTTISFAVPDFNVIKPTPTSTPSPPGSKKNSVIEEPIPPLSSPTPPLVCPFRSAGSQKTEKEKDRDTDEEDTLSPTSGDDTLSSTKETDLSKPEDLDHHYHAHISLLASLRNNSMSPLHEDMNEEEGVSLANMDEGIDVRRKSSDMSNCSSESGGGGSAGGSSSTKDKKQSFRKNSDISVHSGESGIESPPDKQSFTSNTKEDVPLESSNRETSVERKLSNSSSVSTEEELATIRHARSGSVSKTVEMFDTLSRQRKTGLTMVGNPKPPTITNANSETPEPSTRNSLSPVTSPLHNREHTSMHWNGGTP